ncbi:Xaa-Pro aminopeptidase [Aliiruegeria haliotis]|uniref:Xaa-Pro aminopeptidase n=1 Tax=Aliiruegeria haliotis TaxID=1280846 RepID=A0A2T0RXV4_9RHOB|nr:aminopeptidase P family protein [Aliiruegeria haliotis]PRY26019.1 Xaa-Pro aminopeptidase [Aliiruegeria haliotis]
MYQSFDVSTRPGDGPPRLAALRQQLARDGYDGFLVPRADMHQGEYVAPHDARLAWLTGFTGSAGFCAVLPEVAGIFVDGRYTLQVRAQVDLSAFTPVAWPKTQLAGWLTDQMPDGGKIAFDPRLHTAEEIRKLREEGKAHGLTYHPSPNYVDAIWQDQPEPPLGDILVHPLEYSGQEHGEKRTALAADLTAKGLSAAVLTLPDSIAWLLNIRGSDIVRNPVPHAFAILNADASVDLFCAPEKLTDAAMTHLGNQVTCHLPETFGAALEALDGEVLLDKGSAPYWVAEQITGAEIHFDRDPCVMPKARKNAAEISGSEQAHLRDGAAMCRFLCWLDAEAPKGKLTEIDVVKRLEAFRAEDPLLRDISFETICGSGPNGAIVHYRVSTESNRRVTPGEILLVDSGGQYADGTTDITRTIATGPVTDAQKACFTRVLQGVIAISRARWPRGLAGRDLDPLARAPLWMAGQDYDHGTGHGVGAYLSVHEGPQRISRVSDVPLEEGMILSNEPGYYREGAFGIRIENLIHVVAAPALDGADDREMLAFANLTWAPIDRRLLDTALMSRAELDWLNGYHAEVRSRLAPLLDRDVAAWLDAATAPV